ncbi:MAG TPA: lamin tail domain-containing protein, partial [Kofleriaceae bacterium]|nr:lamin tail domain-containing protein [Kofleriaceae bacterium]
VDSGWNCDQSEPSVCQAEGCGDGIIQTGEECDDDNTTANDGCDATCNIEPNFTCMGEPSVCVMKGCGNGFIEDAEECDDGNTADHDRCSSTCVLEQDTTEATEPNNTTPQALTAGNHIVRGTFETGDVDLYTFTLGGTSQVEIETYATINGTTADYAGIGTTPVFDCLTTVYDTEVAVFPAAVDTTVDANALAIDDDDGDLYCSYVGPNDGADPTQLATLAAGTYTIRLRPSTIATTIPAGTRYMLDLKITPMNAAPSAPAAGDLKINEFLAADGGTTNGGVDSNCDGLLTNSDDEFIELVNVSTKTLDLTGVTIADALSIKFTFAPQANGSLTLAPGKAVVVWGGGNPACPGVTNFFTNGTAHTLSLNDAGDTITVATGGTSPVTIATTTYGAATIGTSFNLSPDVTGTTYALHTAVTGHVGNLSPGKKVDGSAF